MLCRGDLSLLHQPLELSLHLQAGDAFPKLFFLCHADSPLYAFSPWHKNRDPLRPKTAPGGGSPDINPQKYLLLRIDGVLPVIQIFFFGASVFGTASPDAWADG